MSKQKVKQIYISFISIFFIVVIGFYFLAGEQLKYRESRYDISMPTIKDASIEELNQNVVVEQRFINLIDRFKSISFECTTHYRENHGIITAELFYNDVLLAKNFYYVDQIEEGVPLVLECDEYIEDLTGKELTLRLTSTSKPGEGVSPLIFSWNSNGTSLKENNKFRIGNLVFATSGQEYIFTGQYYWHLTISIGVILAIILFISYKKYCNNKVDYIVTALNAIEHYEFLISQLVTRDFKSKYKRSLLGVFWSFLNPLLTMTVQYFVFSTFFRSNIDNYPVYLLSGVVCYSFFNECTSKCLTSIAGNYRLITKVYIPKYIFPLSHTLSTSVNLALTLIPLLLVSILTGVVLHQSIILSIFFFICLIIFSLGIGMILASLMVFFRDIQFLWSVVCMMWMYATPIFYPASIIPARFSFIIRLNPLYHFVKNVRICLIDGISPDPKNYLYCALFALGSLLIGSLVFKKTQDKFTLYL